MLFMVLPQEKSIKLLSFWREEFPSWWKSYVQIIRKPLSFEHDGTVSCQDVDIDVMWFLFIGNKGDKTNVRV